MKFIRIAILLFCISINAEIKAQVVINEYSCANLSYFFDNYTSYEDWIELYNPTVSPVNIGGYYLSDKLSQPTKWRIPNGVTINASGYLKIWASGRNEMIGANLHTNFKLTQTKFPTEVITLANASGTVIDNVPVQITQKHHSRGRNPNGGANWSIFTTPSPGLANVLASALQRYAAKPLFSVAAGFYPGTQLVTITTTESNSVIHYTTDGTAPTASSPVFSSALTIDSTKVLKAYVVSTMPGIGPSFVNFATYFINDVPTLPVISISGDDLETLANGDQSLKPEGTIEYFNGNHVRKTSGYGTFNSHGQDSWANDQRSLDFVMRDELGYNYALQEQLFNLTPRSEFQRVILRAAGDDNYPAAHNASNDGSAHVRDAYLQNLAKTGGLDLDVRIGTKCIIYIDGIYWGVYDIRERPDDHDYTDYYYKQNKFNLQYIETWGTTWSEYGGQAAQDAWDTMYTFIMNNNMAIPANWDYVTSKFDVNSLVDYVIVNSFSVCSDWLNYNTGWWRGLDSAGTHKKWGFILWDNDAIFGFYINYTGIPEKGANAAPCNAEILTSDPNGHIEILNKMFENQSFKDYYINRYADLANTVFSCNTMIPTLDSIVAVIDPEMARHALRWFGTYSEWQTNVQTLRNYIIDRCNLFPSKMDSCYNLNGPYPFTISCEPIGTGKIKINTLTLSDFPFSGNYYGGIATTLLALPDSLNGFSFDHWEIHNNSVLPSPLLANAQINIHAGDTLIAHFRQGPVKVNEFNTQNIFAIATPSVFSRETNISFYMNEKNDLNIHMVSSLGKIVYSKNVDFIPGFNKFTLNLQGKGIAPGVYFLNLQSERVNKTIRVIYTGE